MKKIIFSSLIAIMSTGFASVAYADGDEDGVKANQRSATHERMSDRRDNFRERKGNMREKMSDRRDNFRERKGNMRERKGNSRQSNVRSNQRANRIGGNMRKGMGNIHQSRR